MNTTVLIVGLMLALKHFLADGPLQWPWMYLNKGNLNHPGGYAHAGLHGVFTALILLMASVAPGAALLLGIVDFFLHYAIDWTKTNYTKKEWAGRYQPASCQDDQRPHLAIYSDWYFYALVLDQALHFATYAVILAVVA